VTTRIEEGMTMIVHPNTYHPKVGYMVLGDALIVTADGADVLIKTPRELFSVRRIRSAMRRGLDGVMPTSCRSMP